MKKNRIIYLCIFLFSCFCIACKLGGDEIQVNLESVKITKNPTKTQYFVGEELDTTGLVLTATYSNGKTAEVEKWTVSGFDSTISEKEQEITVSYSENQVTKKTSFKISIIEIAIVKLKITPPSKVEYYEGEKLDSEGMIVEAEYNNGFLQVIENYVCDFDSQVISSGTKNITVSYGDLSGTFEITVLEQPIEFLKIIPPSKTNYHIGEEFDPEGMSVTAVKKSGEEIQVIDFVTDFDEVVKESGTHNVTVTYKGRTITFSIHVDEIKIVELIIGRKPNKLDYFEEDLFDPTGLIVRAKYEDNTIKTITGYTTNAAEQLATEGRKEVTIKYDNISTSFTIYVKKLILLNLDFTPPSQTDYHRYEPLNLADMKVIAVYNSGVNIELDYSELTITGFNSTAGGPDTVTVSYKDKTCSFSTYVYTYDVKSIAVTPPETTTYYFNDSFDSSGMIVTATYTDNKTASVSGYTMNFDSQVTTLGDKNVTVSLAGKSASFGIKVIAQNMEFKTRPTKTTYYVDESFDSTGLELTFTNPIGDIINSTSFYTTDFDIQNKTSGSLEGVNKTITVSSSYCDVQLSFTVLMKDHPQVVYQLHETIEVMPEGTTGTNGSNSTYVLFGDWPQSYKADGVELDLSRTVKMNKLDVYVGYDGNYYVPRKISDRQYYFKIEPVKWRVLTKNYDSTNQALLFTDSIIDYQPYVPSNDDRTIDGKTVKPYSYKYSEIRAFLCGLEYYEMNNNSLTLRTKYSNSGFLQKAFSENAQALLIATEQDNTASSTFDVGGELAEINGGATNSYCESDGSGNTNDKVFLLSLKDITTEEYGFKTKYSEKDSLKMLGVTSYCTWYCRNWFTRSPKTNPSGNNSKGEIIYVINLTGEVSNYGYDLMGKATYGIAPAIVVNSDYF